MTASRSSTSATSTQRKQNTATLRTSQNSQLHLRLHLDKIPHVTAEPHLPHAHIDLDEAEPVFC